MPTQVSTHRLCNERAVDILQNDGWRSCYATFRDFKSDVDAGTLWADLYLKNSRHFYDPDADAGLFACASALETCRQYFCNAVTTWQRGFRSQAFFWVGAASHLLQDMCVPHHAACTLLAGHKSFENLARRRFESHKCSKGGLYGYADDIGSWIIKNARASKPWLSIVLPESKEAHKREAISALLPLAQRSTAGFFAFFLACVT